MSDDRPQRNARSVTFAPADGGGVPLGPALATLARWRRHVEEESEALVQEAKVRAEEIVAAARQEAERLKLEGYEAGYMAGQREAADEVANRAEGLFRRLQQAMETVEKARHGVVERSRGDIVKLALAIAEKIVRERIENDDEIAARLLDELLPRWEGVGGVTVRCHPDEAEEAQEYLEESGLGRRWGSELRIVADEGVSRGGVVLESSLGQLDASLETRLARIGRALETWLAEEEND